MQGLLKLDDEATLEILKKRMADFQHDPGETYEHILKLDEACDILDQSEMKSVKPHKSSLKERQQIAQEFAQDWSKTQKRAHIDLGCACGAEGKGKRQGEGESESNTFADRRAHTASSEDTGARGRDDLARLFA